MPPASTRVPAGQQDLAARGLEVAVEVVQADDLHVDGRRSRPRPLTIAQAGHLDDDRLVVVGPARVAPGAERIVVVVEHEQAISGERQHALDRLERESERVAEAEVAFAPGQRDQIRIADVQQIDERGAGQEAIGSGRAQVERVDALHACSGALRVVALDDQQAAFVERREITDRVAGFVQPRRARRADEALGLEIEGEDQAPALVGIGRQRPLEADVQLAAVGRPRHALDAAAARQVGDLAGLQRRVVR